MQAGLRDEDVVVGIAAGDNFFSCLNEGGGGEDTVGAGCIWDSLGWLAFVHEFR